MKNENTRDPGRQDDCSRCRGQFQDYLDETLPRKASMELFLHLRGCDSCRDELEEMKGLFTMLGTLPQTEAPADFDQRVLASIPYAAYREMEPLRRERVPVLLEEESLPAFVRAGATRLVGGVAAVVCAVGLAAGSLPDAAAAVLVIGALPEAVVQLQRFSRRLYVEATQKSTQR